MARFSRFGITSLLGDLGREVLALEHPESQDDELPQLAVGAVGSLVLEGLRAGFHLDEIALAGKAEVPVAQLVTVPRNQAVPGGYAVLVVGGEGEDDEVARAGCELVGVVDLGNALRSFPRSVRT